MSDRSRKLVSVSMAYGFLPRQGFGQRDPRLRAKVYEGQAA